jgi:hypothetical protein
MSDRQAKIAISITIVAMALILGLAFYGYLGGMWVVE